MLEEKNFVIDKHGNKVIKSLRVGEFEFRATYPLFRYEINDAYYEIVRWRPNPYYQRRDDFEENMYKKGMWRHKEHSWFNVNESTFDVKESCYTVAHFIYDKDENCYDLRSVADRIVFNEDNITEDKKNNLIANMYHVIHYGFNMLNELCRKEDCDD